MIRTEVSILSNSRIISETDWISFAGLLHVLVAAGSKWVVKGLKWGQIASTQYAVRGQRVGGCVFREVAQFAGPGCWLRLGGGSSCVTRLHRVWYTANVITESRSNKKMG